MRYLHRAAIELAERLIATCPPTSTPCCSSTPAPRPTTSPGAWPALHRQHAAALCTDFAYHGITDAIAPLSPETCCAEAATDATAHVEPWRPPTPTAAGPRLAEFDAALDRLAAKGIAPAAAILDGVHAERRRAATSTPSYVAELVRLTHEAGGLWIADEVQGGHGRTGDAMWSFQRFGIKPDFVTLGKPMGNGHPVAAVITRREYLRAVRRRHRVLLHVRRQSGVGGGRACAVLDVLDDERVLPRVVRGRRGVARGRPRGHRATSRSSATSAEWVSPTASRSSRTGLEDARLRSAGRSIKNA